MSEPEIKCAITGPIRLRELANLLDRLADQYGETQSRTLGGAYRHVPFVVARDPNFSIEYREVYQ